MKIIRTSPARDTDPEASHMAAGWTPGRQSQCQALLRVFRDHPEGLISEEAVFYAGLVTARSPWTRVSDLKRAKYVEDTGMKRRASSGALQTVWVITEKGKSQL